jgi:hypothetical protein
LTDTASHLHAVSAHFEKGEAAEHQDDSASHQAKVSLPEAAEGQRQDDRPPPMKIDPIRHHILVQSPTLIFFVKVIVWQITWLNKECRDQVILLPGFDYIFFFLWPCSCVFSHYVFELFSFFVL